MKHLRKIQVSDGNYKQLSQQELLQKLSDIGISITAQTLRNWEQKDLISPAFRTGVKKEHGLRVAYTGINIAEAFAVWVLTKNIGIVEGLIGKYTLRQVRIARYMFLKLKIPMACELSVHQNYCDIKTPDREIEELIKDLPDIKIDRDGKWHFDIKIDNKIKDTEKKISVINLLTIYSSLFFEGLFIVNDWESCVGT